MIGIHFILTHEMESGHARRCYVLAHTLFDAGQEIVLFADKITINLAKKHMPSSCNYNDVGSSPASVLNSIDEFSLSLLIVDRKDLDITIEQRLRSQVGSLVVLDGFSERSHDCDILLSQSPGRQPVKRDMSRNKNTNILGGAEYALLRPEFYMLRNSMFRPLINENFRPCVFICFGSVDPTGLTFQIAKVLLPIFGNTVKFDIVIGKDSLNLEKLKSLVSSVSNAALHIDDENVAARMAAATVAICAPGIMLLECCCLYLPSLLISDSTHQIEIGKMADNMGIASYLGNVVDVDFSRSVPKLKQLLENFKVYEEMSEKAGRVTDGVGADRIIAALIPPRDNHGIGIRLRLMTENDVEVVLQWQNSDGLRRFFHNTGKISWVDHLKWSENRLMNFPLETYIACDDEMTPLGLVHLSPVSKEAKNTGFWISLLVAPDVQGRGVGTAILKWIVQVYSRITLFAEISDDNIASIKAFKAAGFVNQGECYVHFPEKKKL